MLSQKLKNNWQWILIPLFMIAEFAIDQIVFGRVCRFVFKLLSINPSTHYILILNLFKSFSVLTIVLLNYYFFKQKFFWQPSKKSSGWIVFAVVCFGIVASTIRTPHFWSALDTGIIAAFPEEFMFRGVILGVVLMILTRVKTTAFRVNLSVVISAILFGAYHYINLSNQSFSFTTMQVISVAGFGLILGAVYVRSGSIIVPILLHFIYDYVVTLPKGFQVTNYSQVSGVQMIALGIWIIIYAIIAYLIVNYRFANNKILPKLKN